MVKEMGADDDFQLLLLAISDETLLKSMDLSVVSSANSLQKVKFLPAVKELSGVLQEAGLRPSLGFNVGSGELSFTCPVFCEDVAERSRLSVLVLTMLGLMPNQNALEEAFLQRQHDEAVSCVLGARKSSNLANLCLEVFAHKTNVGISQRKVCGRSRTIKIVVGSYQELSVGKVRRVYSYAPCYYDLSGWSDNETHARLREDTSCSFAEILLNAKTKLIEEMMEHFWLTMDSFPYVSSSELRVQLGEILSSYLSSGISDQSSGFLPSQQEAMSLFLCGSAGTGKSTLVQALSVSLQSTLNKFLDPERKVSIVKVPLNGLTPDSLRMILCVQGISDWSIERMLEQAIAKGGTAVLHLEEVPEEPKLQEDLYKCVSSMLEVMIRRYPKFGGNLIHAFTSNYPPADAIRAISKELVIVAPSGRKQEEHCLRMLERGLRRRSGIPHVSMKLSYELPAMLDMRPLFQWWTTLTFHISSSVEKLLAELGGSKRAAGLDGDLSSDSEGKAVEVRLLVYVGDGEEEDSLSEARAGEELGVSKGVPDAVVGRTERREVKFTVKSSDGFFFLHTQDVIVEHADREYKNAALIDMCSSGFLKPCVIVVKGGGKGKQLDFEAALLQQLRQQAGDGEDVAHTSVELRKESDKEQVNGHQSQIRGGLFKFIDDCNNPNRKSSRMCLVTCHVNEVGQYMLRELLETNGESRTHRYAIRKDRVMFLLLVDEESALQEMTLSRAHDIVQL
mmetsp:Transcript_30101/g.96833  ORF Transcript_30101/g.96833 Transcript_30101/m.96833 type:complete len:734 (-) Transcript_30101:1652-3853(-)